MNVRYVVLVREPLPEDMTAAVRQLAERFDLTTERAQRLLDRAPGPLTRPVAERDARHVAAVLRSAGLTVEVREGSVDGRLMEWILPELPPVGAEAGPTGFAGGRGSEPDPLATEVGPRGSGHDVREASAGDLDAEPDARATPSDAPATDADVRATPSDVRAYEPDVRGTHSDVRVTDIDAGGDTGGDADVDVRATQSDARASQAELRATHPDVRATHTDLDETPTAIPVDPRSTQGDRESDPAERARARVQQRQREREERAPEASRAKVTPVEAAERRTRASYDTEPHAVADGRVRRRVASAAIVPALFTLLLTVLALAVVLLPLLRSQEARHAAAVANSVAASVEGLSSGLPLTSPLMRAQVAHMADVTAARLPGFGVDYLVLLDAEGQAQVVWYRGETGEEALPPELRTALERRARAPGGPGGPSGSAAGANATAENATWEESVRAAGNDLLALLGLAETEPLVASAPIRRAGSSSGAVMAGVEALPLDDLRRALITAALIGLIPVLFGVLAAANLSRALRDGRR